MINQAFELSESLIIGRADDCDVRIDDEGVAARQAEVQMSPDGSVRLKDLGSGNGVLLNGERVTQAELSSGDEIRIGNCRLMLQAPGLRPDRVLQGEAIRPPRQHWPWLLALAIGAVAALAMQRGWLDTLLSGL